MMHRLNRRNVLIAVVTTAVIGGAGYVLYRQATKSWVFFFVFCLRLCSFVLKSLRNGKSSLESFLDLPILFSTRLWLSLILPRYADLDSSSLTNG
jgi:hypothetical protein